MRTRRLRTVLWASLAVALALLVVAGVAWTNYTHSPSYSVGQLGRAATDGDWNGVQKYVDVEAVVSQLVDTATTGVFGERDSWLAASAGDVADSTKPALTRVAKGVLRNSIEMGPDRPGTVVDLAGLFAMMSVKSVTIAGDQALVTVQTPYGDERVVEVKLRMKRVDNFWRVIAIEDFSPFAAAGD